MKSCPSCRKTYEDESLVFCLDDGSRLVRDSAAHDDNPTWNLPGPTVASPRPASPTSPIAQPTLTARPEHFQMASPAAAAEARGESRRGALPWVFAIVLVLGASGVLIAWLVTRGGAGDTDTSGRYPAPTPVPSIGATPSPEATAETRNSPTPVERPSETPKPTMEIEKPPVPTPTAERPKPAFAFLNNTSLDGSRITYYQRTSFAGCQADCARNPNCAGLTWIKPGAYNPSDPGMCYLMSAVTRRIPTPNHMSAVRN